MKRCRLCAAEELQRIADEDLDSDDYYHCPECDLIMLPEAELPAPAEERRRYLDHDNTFATSGYVRMFEEFIGDFIEPRLEEMEKALDFGCGPGPVLATMLKERGLDVDIYDPYFFPEDDFLEEKYDLITSTEVFEHLSSPAEELEILLDVLKPGKYLALMTSLHPGPEEMSGWNYRHDDTHITFFSWQTVKWLEENYPLRIAASDRKKVVLLRRTGR